ncbi:hypothetical protein BD410DRAFT_782935 [Rickenella mellea]|uniref:Uncharacterized protein n=1 Tax=Rickenella mellea TaxID=50990 RepID=A0A4Y7QHX5_9AGAM|nr:hypothetical protein BD410DRAFT_782935 [Rickenella mellea]
MESETSSSLMTELTDDMIADLVNNQQRPSNTEISLVRENISALQILLSVKALAVVQAQKDLDEAMAQWEVTCDRLDRLKSIVSPITLIPDEVLSKIFVHCLPEDGQGKHLPPVPSIWSSPLLLTRVCRRWTDVALSTHHLWAGMTLTKKLCDGKFDQITKATDEWIGRSGACPLSFNFQCGSDSKDETGINDLVQVIIRHAHRWQRISGSLPRPVLTQIFSKLSDGVPLLETLDLCEGRLKYVSDDGLPVDVSSAPRLRKFCSSAKYNIRLAFNGTMLHNLRTIVIGRVRHASATLEDVWSCFKHCPNLQLSHFFISTQGSQNFGPDMLQVAALETCHITTSADPGPLLDHITLPAMQCLLLSFSGADHLGQILAPGPPQLSWHHLDSLLERSHPPLQELSLSMFNMSEQTLVSCLRQTPDIEKLEIAIFEVTDYFLCMMTNNSDVGHNNSPDPCHYLCPRLQDLCIEESGRFTADAMVDMILSRRAEPPDGNSCQLESFCLDNCEFEGRRLEEDDPALRQCIEEGMNIIIS